MCLLRGSWKLNSDGQAWQEVPVPVSHLLDPGVGFPKVVNEFLMGRLGEHSLFPEAVGLPEVLVGLRDGIKGGLGTVTQGASVAPG